MGPSNSDELGRYVNRSTNEKTFVMRVGGAGEPVAVELLEAGEIPGVAAIFSFSFSLPRPVAEANAFMNGLVSLTGATTATCLLLLGPACDFAHWSSVEP